MELRRNEIFKPPVKVTETKKWVKFKFGIQNSKFDETSWTKIEPVKLVFKAALSISLTSNGAVKPQAEICKLQTFNN